MQDIYLHHILDLTSNTFVQFNTIQGDGDKVRGITFELIANNAPYILDADTVEVSIGGTKPDGTTVLNDCTITEEGYVSVDITSQMTTVAGRGEYQLFIIDKNADSQLKSYPFYIFTNEASVDIENVVSSDEFKALTKALNSIDEACDKAEEALTTATNLNEQITLAESEREENEATRKSNETSRDNAENKRISNENTRIQNEDNRVSSENARIENEDKRDSSEQERVENEIARLSNEDKRVSVEKNRVEAENIRISNEDIRQDNESDRIASESVRVSAENERITNENFRVQNEADRVSTESIRQQNEDGRQTNETLRETNESNRKDNEEERLLEELQRVESENLRISSENDRLTNEEIRMANEEIRVSNEVVRNESEENRQTKENNRVDAETIRSDAETKRISAENIRIANESERVANELSRQSAETERQTNTATAISNAEIATERANSAAEEIENIIRTTSPTLYNSHAGGIKLNGLGGVSEQGGNPSPDNPQEIRSVVVSEIKAHGKNFVNPNTFINALLGSTDGSLVANSIWATSDFIDTHGANAVTVSSSCWVVRFAEYDANKQHIKTRGNVVYTNNTSKTLTLDENCAYIRITIGDETSMTPEEMFAKYWVQIEEGTEETDYEPYTEQSIILSEPVELRGIGEIKDELVPSEGSIVRNIKRRRLLSTDDWVIHADGWIFASNITDFAITGLIGTSTYLSDGICTHFNYFHDRGNITYTKTEGITLWYEASYDGYRCALYSPSFSSVEEWKAYLDENEVYIEYAVAEPVIEPLSTADQIALHSLMSYDGITHLYCDSEVQPAWDLEYGISSTGAYGLDTLNRVENLEMALDKSLDMIETSSEKIDLIQESIKEISVKTQENTDEIASVSSVAEEALSISKGKNQSRVFTTTDDMNAWLSNADNKGLAKIGDNLYIVDVGVPDWWISKVLEEPNSNGMYYEVAQLETQKANLTNIESELSVIGQTITVPYVEVGINDNVVVTATLCLKKLSTTKCDLHISYKIASNSESDDTIYGFILSSKIREALGVSTLIANASNSQVVFNTTYELAGEDLYIDTAVNTESYMGYTGSLASMDEDSICIGRITSTDGNYESLSITNGIYTAGTYGQINWYGVNYSTN